MEKMLIEVSLIDKMGSDLSVVNAARVSFANKHEEFNDTIDVVETVQFDSAFIFKYSECSFIKYWF